MGRITDSQKAFSEIYRRNAWFGGSGHGSRPEYTAPYVALLQEFLRSNRIQTAVDFGCGDWQVAKQLDWSGIRYVGFDVVESLVRENQRSFGSNTISFRLAEGRTLLPPADLLICKDVLQHLPNREVQHYLSIFKRLYKFIIITNDVFPDAYTNREIENGGVRPIRLDLPPFCEQHKVLLEWKVDDPDHPTTKHTCLLLGTATSLQAEDIPLEIPYTTNELIRRELKRFVHYLRLGSPVLRPPIDMILSIGRRLRRRAPRL